MRTQQSDISSEIAPTLLRCMQPVVDELYAAASQKGIRVAIDVPTQILWRDQTTPWSKILMPLVSKVVSRTEGQGEVLICAHQKGENLEIEFSDGGDVGLQNDSSSVVEGDSTSGLDKPTTLDFTTVRVSKLLARYGGSLTIANCPQGGKAWTICLPNFVASESSQRKVAQ